MISGRLDLHKILLLVGPTRAGKGVIARILGALVGAENVAGPTLSSLNGDFGLAPLLGKTLAVVSDARLNGRGAHVVVERLLSISRRGHADRQPQVPRPVDGEAADPAHAAARTSCRSSATRRWRSPAGSCRCC